MAPPPSFASGPPEGNFQALANTGAGVSDTALESAFALPLGSLDAVGNGNAVEGGEVTQTFSASAGDTIGFRWNFLTNEATPSTSAGYATTAPAIPTRIKRTATVIA